MPKKPLTDRLPQPCCTTPHPKTQLSTEMSGNACPCTAGRQVNMRLWSCRYPWVNNKLSQPCGGRVQQVGQVYVRRNPKQNGRNQHRWRAPDDFAGVIMRSPTQQPEVLTRQNVRCALWEKAVYIHTRVRWSTSKRLRLLEAVCTFKTLHNKQAALAAASMRCEWGGKHGKLTAEAPTFLLTWCRNRVGRTKLSVLGDLKTVKAANPTIDLMGLSIVILSTLNPSLRLFCAQASVVL